MIDKRYMFRPKAWHEVPSISSELGVTSTGVHMALSHLSIALVIRTSLTRRERVRLGAADLKWQSQMNRGPGAADANGVDDHPSTTT